jgi:hypothetical protein
MALRLPPRKDWWSSAPERRDARDDASEDREEES